MKNIKYLLAIICSASVLTGCLEKYQNLNTDPELLGEVNPVNVFTGATQNFNNCSRGHLTGKYSGTMIYMQYLVGSGGANAKSYITLSNVNERPQPNGPAYNTYYNVNGDGYGGFGLRLDYLVNTVIPNNAEAERYNDVKAIAQILLSYQQWQVLDTYGAAPITEGLRAQSEGVRTPRYDLYQKAVDGTPMYKKIDADVKAAVALLKASDATQYGLGTNDFFYNGDVAKWIKFGNTLRVKMAQRLEKADPAFYNEVINEVLASASNVMGSNEESCIYYHPNDYNNNTDDIQDITKNYVASRAFVNYLKTYDDPRLPILVRRNGFGDGNNNDARDERYKLFDSLKVNYTSADSLNYPAIYEMFKERYVGMSANPDSATDAKNKYQHSAYLGVGHDLKVVNGKKVFNKTVQMRMYSQVESRYFVKNGGRNGNNNMPAEDIEHKDFEVNQDNIDCFTPIITYPETCFMLAEIAVKKGAAVAGKDATAWFKEGIRASINQYKQWATNMYVVAQVSKDAPNYDPVDDAKINAYLAKSEFQNATLEKIISQQWINLYRQPEEMWATWKRTGLPAFKAQPDPVDGVAFLEEIHNSGNELVIPRRNSLPTPNTLNIDNYNAAVQALTQDANYGTDTDRTEGRIWWDQK